MLDLRKQFSRDLVEEMDDKRRHQHERSRRWLAVVPTACTAILLWALFPGVFASLAVPLAIDRFVFLGAVGLGYMWLFGQLRPFRSMVGVLSKVAPEETQD